MHVILTVEGLSEVQMKIIGMDQTGKTCGIYPDDPCHAVDV